MTNAEKDDAMTAALIAEKMDPTARITREIATIITDEQRAELRRLGYRFGPYTAGSEESAYLQRHAENTKP